MRGEWVCVTAGEHGPGPGLWTFLPSLACVGQCSGGRGPSATTTGAQPGWMQRGTEGRDVGPRSPRPPTEELSWYTTGSSTHTRTAWHESRQRGGPLTLTQERLRGKGLPGPGAQREPHTRPAGTGQEKEESTGSA